MKECADDKELLQIRQCVTILTFDTIRLLNQFGLQHPEVLKVYRVLNRSIMYQEKILNAKLWLHEATEKNQNKIPNNQDELKQYITELRSRLVMIADIYGFNSPKTLLYSQYLDQFIVRFIKEKVEKPPNEHA